MSAMSTPPGMRSLEGDGAERQRAVTSTLARIRKIAQPGVDRSVLEAILGELKRLATHREWWSDRHFAAPVEPERQARYLICEDVDHRFALYLNVMRPGKLIPPHNHTTWACIAAVEGAELNRVYRRTDDGSREGIGILEEDHAILVQPGMGIALMPDDIHAVAIEGSDVIRHLHLYGRALETLVDRITFDLATNTCARMNIGVSTRRVGAG